MLSVLFFRTLLVILFVIRYCKYTNNLVPCKILVIKIGAVW